MRRSHPVEFGAEAFETDRGPVLDPAMAGLKHDRTAREAGIGLQRYVQPGIAEMDDVVGMGAQLARLDLAGDLRKTVGALPTRLDEEAKKAGDGLIESEGDEAEGVGGVGSVVGVEGVEEQRLQVHSEFAVQALRRAADKLAGIEPAYAQAGMGEEEAEREVTGPLSVREQVAWLIEEASNVDHLCRMYEGWAPWI